MQGLTRPGARGQAAALHARPDCVCPVPRCRGPTTRRPCLSCRHRRP